MWKDDGVSGWWRATDDAWSLQSHQLYRASVMADSELAGSSSTAGRCDRLVPASRRRSTSDPAGLCTRATDDDTPSASAADHVTGSTTAYPGFVGRAFFVLDQTTIPRSWCLRLVTWPYPFLYLCIVCVCIYTVALTFWCNAPSQVSGHVIVKCINSQRPIPLTTNGNDCERIFPVDDCTDK